MLARLSTKLPVGPNWLYEPKLDGFRGLLAKDGSDIRIYSRRGRLLEPFFPELLGAALEELPASCIVDGEIVASDFEALQRRLVSRKGTAVSFVAFDLLALEGDDLRSKPLARRREVLEAP